MQTGAVFFKPGFTGLIDGLQTRVPGYPGYDCQSGERPVTVGLQLVVSEVDSRGRGAWTER